MGRRYSYSTRPGGILSGDRLHYYQGPVLSKAEIDALAEAKIKRVLAARRREQHKRFSKGHIRNVVKYLPYIRACRDHCRVPRKVPKKVMDTVFALALW